MSTRVFRNVSLASTGLLQDADRKLLVVHLGEHDAFSVQVVQRSATWASGTLSLRRSNDPSLANHDDMTPDRTISTGSRWIPITACPSEWLLFQVDTAESGAVIDLYVSLRKTSMPLVQNGMDDGDYGDVTVSGNGTVMVVDNAELLTLDITGGTEDTAPALLSDYTAVYDASAGANRKVLLANVNAAFNLKRMFLVWDDFMSVSAPMGLSGATSGTGASISNSGTFAAANIVGVAALSTGTTTTGRAALTGFTLSVVFGTYVWHFEALAGGDPVADATNDYTLRLGFIDSASAESTDGHFFRYNYNVNSGRWQAVTRSNSVETATDTGVTYTEYTLWRFDVDVSADGLSAVFKINGSTVATHTSASVSMPTGTSRAAGYGFYIQKAAGTTARNLYIDYHMVYSVVSRS